MCGIFGYNFTEEFSKKLPKTFAVDLLKVGIEYNLHRGVDAGGWMASNSKDVFMAKRGGHPLENIVDKELFPRSVPNVMGVHTRASTRGDASKSWNNHPVAFAGVLATHNGTIHNHRMIKEKFSGVDEDKLPEVDSVAIPILFANTVPTDRQNIHATVKRAVETFHGSFAFSMMWRKYPGYQLLVRGKTSPLIVAYFDGGYIYGSEVDSVFAGLTAVEAKDYSIRSLHEGTYLLVHNGLASHWGYVPVVRQQPGTPWKKKETTLRRKVVNATKPNSYITDNSTYSHFTDDDLPHSMVGGVLSVDLKKYDVEVVKPDSFASSRILRDSTRKMVGDATVVYAVKKKGAASKDRRLYIFYGDMADLGAVEIIVSEYGTVQDVYYHPGKVKFDFYSRWEPVQKKKEQKKKSVVEKISIEDFVKDLTSHVQPPKSLPSPKAGRDSRSAGSNAGQLALYNSYSDFFVNNGIMSTKFIVDPDTKTRIAIFELRDKITHQVFDKWMFRELVHSRGAWVDVTNSGEDKCPTHDVEWWLHDNPFDCDDLDFKLSTSFDWMSFDEMIHLLDDPKVVRLGGINNCNHRWVDERLGTGEKECSVCKMVMRIYDCSHPFYKTVIEILNKERVRNAVSS